MDAVKKAGKAFEETPMNQMPARAIEYAKFLGNKYGMCGEVLLTAYAHYYQAVEGLPCKDSLYQIDQQGKDFFATH